MLANSSEPVRFKGQMISVPETDLLMFVGSPRFTEIEDMARVGVYFSDFPVHDASKDLVLLSHYQKGERELVEKLDEASNHLKVGCLHSLLIITVDARV